MREKLKGKKERPKEGKEAKEKERKEGKIGGVGASHPDNRQTITNQTIPTSNQLESSRVAISSRPEVR